MKSRLDSVLPDKVLALPALDLPRPPGVRMTVTGPGADALPRAEMSPPERRLGRGGLADQDAAIDRAVRAAIAPVLDRGAARVSVKVRQAHVTLDGGVPSAKLRDAIGRAAVGCPGVAGVDNRLTIEPGSASPVVLTPERRTVTIRPDGRRGR